LRKGRTARFPAAYSTSRARPFPGATVTAKSAATGFTRSEVSDTEGVYRLSALPIGVYDVTAELQGFTTVSKKAVEVNVGQNQNVDFPLKGRAARGNGQRDRRDAADPDHGPLRSARSSTSSGSRASRSTAVSSPISRRRCRASVSASTATRPRARSTRRSSTAAPAGTSTTRSTAATTTTTTVGGSLQPFPLEAVEQFNFQTQRFKAEYGRSNGGVLSVVTKSGTNLWSGSGFEFFRDKSMNALTETEILAAPTGSAPVKGDYRRNQFGGSFGGPIAKDQAHFFFALERTNLDTTQAVNTQGLFPSQDGVFAVPTRDTPFTGKVTANMSPNQFLSVRYGRATNSAPYGAAPNSTPNNWGDSTNKYQLDQPEPQLGDERVEAERVHLPVRRLRQHHHLNAAPCRMRASRTVSPPALTATRRRRRSSASSSSATTSRGTRAAAAGSATDFKVGVNFINEPHLFITFNTGKGAIFNTHITNDVNGPISLVTVSDGDASANIPMKQFATYFQDDWRVTDRLTLNFGVRYDIMTGYQIDESKNPNFVALQAAGAAGKLSGIVGLENFGQTPKEDFNNIQPRVGAVMDVRGNGKDIVRGGFGVYMDVGYTNSNVLFAAADSTGQGFGQTFQVNVTNGIKNADGSFYRSGQPLSNISNQNLVVNTGAFPLFGQFVDPRLQQPYQMQSNFGWSHELTSDTVISADYVNSLGRDLNLRPRVNQRIPGSVAALNLRRVSVLLPSPAQPQRHRHASDGEPR